MFDRKIGAEGSGLQDLWHFVILTMRCLYYDSLEKGPRVSTDIFHDGLRRETCSDIRIMLAQSPIILAMPSVHFANFLRDI